MHFNNRTCQKDRVLAGRGGINRVKNKVTQEGGSYSALIIKVHIE